MAGLGDVAHLGHAGTHIEWLSLYLLGSVMVASALVRLKEFVVWPWSS